MDIDAVFKESEHFAAALLAALNLPLLDDSTRIRVSGVACSMSLEHWNAVRALLAAGLLPSGLVVHRSQFESLVRSLWILYAASDNDIGKLSVDLTTESEQGSKDTPQVAKMMEALSTKAPSQAHDALRRFKDNSWNALNSYVHAGIHPLRRHEEGYPTSLLVAALRNANGLAVISGMQAVVLAGRQPLQKQLLELATRHSKCMPPPL